MLRNIGLYSQRSQAKEAPTPSRQSTTLTRCAMRVISVQIERASRALRRHGIFTLLKYFMRTTLHRCVRAVTRKYVDWRFDRSHGIDTGGIVPVREMGLDARRDAAEQYEATRPSLFREMIGSLALDCSKFCFVDLGCGKGRALLLAAEAGFKEIIGVELSPVLSGIAQQNVDRCHGVGKGKPQYRVVCVDAAEYQLPAGPCVLYLYNPFKGEVLQRVVRTLGTTYEKQGHEIIVLYYNPIWERVLEEANCLQRVKEARAGTCRYVVYRTPARATTGVRSKVRD